MTPKWTDKDETSRLYIEDDADEDNDEAREVMLMLMAIT